MEHFVKFTKCLQGSKRPWNPCPHHLFINDSGAHSDERFAVGPSNNRMYFDDGRSGVVVDRGPCKNSPQYTPETPPNLTYYTGTSVESHLAASAYRETACIRQSTHFPQPRGMHGGPRQYQPSSDKKLSVLRDYLKVAPFLLPKDRTLHSSVIWHSDLHTDNIFVDPNDPVKIVGIIDWQSAHFSPLFLQARTPALLNFDGPLPESFQIKLPENFNLLSPEDQEVAKKLRSM